MTGEEKAPKRPRGERRRVKRRARRGEKPLLPAEMRRPALLVVASIALVAGVTAALVLLFAQREDADRQQVRELAKLSVEILPSRDWDRLYALFSQEYQARCPKEEFDQVWDAAVENLGVNLFDYRVREVRDIRVRGDRAAVTLVAEIPGQEFRFHEEFVREEGVWKFAPAVGTEGCDAFSTLPATPTPPIGQ